MTKRRSGTIEGTRTGGSVSGRQRRALLGGTALASLIAAGLCVVPAGPAAAQTWLGVTPDYGTPLNWSTGDVPDEAGETATFLGDGAVETTVDLDGGTFAPDAVVIDGSDAFTIANGTLDAALTNTAAANQTVTANLNGDITQDAADPTTRLQLEGTNNTQGDFDVTIASGRIAVLGGNAIGDGDRVLLDATGELALGDDETVGGLAGPDGVVALGDETLTLAGVADGTAQRFDGEIRGPGAVIVDTGGPVQTLGGANTFQGPLTIASGELALVDGGTLQTRAITVEGVDPADPLDTPGTLSTDGGALAAGTVLVVDGRLELDGSEDIGAGTVTAGADATVTLAADRTLTAANVSNTGTLDSDGTLAAALDNAGQADLQGRVEGDVANTGTAVLQVTGPLTVAGDLDNLDAARVRTGGNALTVEGDVTNASPGVTGEPGVSVAAGGRIEATRIDNASGASIASAGTLQADAVTNAAGASLASTGTIDGAFTNAGDANVSGAVVGSLANSGALNITDDTVVTVVPGPAGDRPPVSNTGDGTVRVENGDLTTNATFNNGSAGAGGTGVGVSIAGGRTLTSASFGNSGAVLVEGELDARGTTPSGDPGTVVQSAGRIANNGVVRGDVDVRGGVAQGVGVFAGDVTVADGAVIGPGQVDGTALGAEGVTAVLDVGGTLDLDGTARFDLTQGDVVAGNDLLVVGGADLEGATLDVGAAGDGRYRLITSATAIENAALAELAGTSSGRLYTTGGGTNLNLAVGETTVQFFDGTDAQGDGTIDGGAGTWNGTETNWTVATGALNDSWQGDPATASVTAVFQTEAGTVTVEGTRGFGGLRFDVDGYELAAGTGGTLTGGTLRANGAGGGNPSTINVVDAADRAVLTVDITSLDGVGIRKVGEGRAVLAGTNTYDGETIVSAGTLVLQGGEAVANGDGDGDGATGAVSVASGATLRVNTTETIASLSGEAGSALVLAGGTTLTTGDAGDDTFAGTITQDATTEGASLVKRGTGTLTLSGDTTLTGATFNGATPQDGVRIAGGTLANAATMTSDVTVEAGTTLANSGTIVGTVTSNGSVNNTPNGEIDTLAVEGGGAINAGTIGTLAVSDGEVTNSGSVTGATTITGGRVTVTGTGTLNGATVTAGTLTDNSGDTGGASGTVRVSGDSTARGRLNGVGTVNSNVVIADGGVLDYRGPAEGQAIAGTLTVENGGTARFDLAAPRRALSVGGEIAVENGAVLDLDSARDGLFRLAVSNGDVNVGETQTVTLENAAGNRFDSDTNVFTTTDRRTGRTALNVRIGTVETQYFDGRDTFGDGEVDGGTGVWTADVSNWTTASGAVNERWSGNTPPSVTAVFQTTGGTVTVVGQQGFGGLDFTVDGYRLEAGAGGELLANDGGSSTATVAAGATATVAVDIAGARPDTGLIVDGPGTLVLAGDNTYGGVTDVQAGRLELGTGTGGTARIAGNVDNGATFVVASNGVVAGGLASAGTTANSGAIVGRVEVDGGFTGNRGTFRSGAEVAAGAELRNAGAIQGTVESSGTFANTGTVDAVAIEAGTFTNTDTVSGDLAVRGGTAVNTGTVAGATAVSGTGELTNGGSGRLDGGLTASNRARVGAAGTIAGNVVLLDGARMTTAGNLQVERNLSTRDRAAFTVDEGRTGGLSVVTNASQAVARDGTGLVAGGLNVREGARLEATRIDNETNGVFLNEGTVVADVENDGVFVNRGRVAGEVRSDGALRNTSGAAIAGRAVVGRDGRLRNNGTIERVRNAGAVNNGGAVTGNVANVAGTFRSQGTIGGDVAITGGTVVATGATTFADAATVNVAGPDAALVVRGRQSLGTLNLDNGVVGGGGTVVADLVRQSGGRVGATTQIETTTYVRTGGTAPSGPVRADLRVVAEGPNAVVEASPDGVAARNPSGTIAVVAGSITLGSPGRTAVLAEASGNVVVDVAGLVGDRGVVARSANGPVTVDVRGATDVAGTAFDVSGAGGTVTVGGDVSAGGTAFASGGRDVTFALADGIVVDAADIIATRAGASATLNNATVLDDAVFDAGAGDTTVVNETGARIAFSAADSDFGGGRDVLTNEGTLSLAAGTRVSGLETIVNTGSIDMRSVPGTAPFQVATFTNGGVNTDLANGSAGVIALDVNLTTGEADRIEIDGTFSGTPTFVLNNVSDERPRRFDDVVLVQAGEIAGEPDEYATDFQNYDQGGFFNVRVRPEGSNVVLTSELDTQRTGAVVSNIVATQNAISTALFRPSSAFATGPLDPIENQIGFAPSFRTIGGFVRSHADGTAVAGNDPASQIATAVDVAYGGYQVGLDGGLYNIGGTGGNAIFGINGGQVFASADGVDFDSQTTMKGVYAGLYGSYYRGPLFVDAQLRQEFNAYSTDVSDNRFQIRDAETDVRRTTASLSAGYGFKVGGYALTPEVGYAFARTATDDLQLRDPAILDASFVDFDDRTSNTVFGGVTLSRAFLLNEGALRVSPFVTATAFHDLTPEAMATLTVERTPVEVQTNPTQSYGELSLGVDVFALTPKIGAEERILRGSARAGVQFGEETLGGSLDFRLRLQF